MSDVKPIPEGWHTVTPHMCVRGAAEAIEFYKKAFGAEEIFRMPGPGGHGVMHAEIKIGDSMIMLADEMPDMGGWVSPAANNGTTVSISLYVEDVDKAFQRAVDAGAEVSMPPADMFWGDRYSKVKDPFGHIWAIAMRKQDLTPEQCAKAAEEFFANMPKGEGCGGA